MHWESIGNFFADYGSSLGALSVLGVLGVFFLTKFTERQNAAIIVIMDIKNAEELRELILRIKKVDMLVKTILPENNWRKYKQLFVSKLSEEDFAAINRFFDDCAQFDDAASLIKQVYLSTLVAKARILQEKLYGIEDPSDEVAESKREQIVTDINTGTPDFIPKYPLDTIFEGLERMGRLTNTVAFEKLKQITATRNPFRRIKRTRSSL